LVRAYHWYDLAAAQGHATGVDRRNALVTRMTPAQLEEARQLAETLKPGQAAPQADPVLAPTMDIPSLAGSAGPSRSGDLIPRAALLMGTRAGHRRLSPNGRRLAYLAPVNGVDNLWVRTLGDGDDRPLTREVERDLLYFAWQCDGEHLLYLQDREGD